MEIDVAVIGGGRAGQAAALAAKPARKRVVLIDQNDCYGQNFLAESLIDEFGRLAQLAPPRAWSNLKTFAERLQAAKPAKRRLQANGIAVIKAQARFLSPSDLLVDHRKIRPKTIIIASGAAPKPPDLPGNDYILDPASFLALPTLPDRVAIIEPDKSLRQLATGLAQTGCRISLITSQSQPSSIMGQVATIEKLQRSYRLNVETPNGPAAVGCDAILARPVWRPRVNDLDLEEAKVAFGPNGIIVHGQVKTTQRRVLAAGACTNQTDLPPDELGQRAGLAATRL